MELCTAHTHGVDAGKMVPRRRCEEVNSKVSTDRTSRKKNTLMVMKLNIIICCVCVSACVCVCWDEGLGGEQSEQLNSCYGDNELVKTL